MRPLRGSRRRALPGRRHGAASRCRRCREPSTTSTGSSSCSGAAAWAPSTGPRHAPRSPRRAEGRARGAPAAIPRRRRRFRREAQIVARLQHPSIVAVYDYGTFADGGAYLVMELVRGEDLRHVLQREGRLDSAESMQILTAVCAAIGAAHREGVLHRDLKPENILLPGGGAAGQGARLRRRQDRDRGVAEGRTVSAPSRGADGA